MKILFSYTYYTKPTESNRDSKDRWTTPHRAMVYGSGLVKTALLLRREFPEARMIVYVPQAEIEELTHRETRCKARRHQYLRQLMRMANVSICAFNAAHIGTTLMPEGQMLRMSRYLPFLQLKEGRAVIVRDADSILSTRDIRYIKDWLKDPTRDYLVYQEIKMGSDMPMGGGIAIKNRGISQETWDQAISTSTCDEYALADMLPADISVELRKLQEQRDTRSQSRFMLRLCGVRMLRMRLAYNGDWYEYADGKKTLLWRDSEEEYYAQKKETATSDLDKDEDFWVR